MQLKEVRCSHCQQFTKDAVCYSKTEKRQFYYCNDCNTRRCKKYRSTPNGAKKVRQALKKSTKKHRKKHNARMLLHYHLRVGKMTKPDCCQKCGKGEVQAHHHDYLKPLEVDWLCIKCHAIEHMDKSWDNDWAGGVPWFQGGPSPSGVSTNKSLF